MKPITLSFLAFLFVCLLGCKKSGSNTPIPQVVKPGISSLSVNSGPYGTSVIVVGTGFSVTQSDNQVFFNGKAAVVTASTATQLTVTVPLAAGTGIVTVIVDGNTATGPVFTYQQTKATISSLSVNTGPYGTSVIITGTSFSATQSDDQVFFNGKAAILTNSTATQLTAIVPLAAGTGNVTVVFDGNTATGPVFTYQISEVISTLAGSGTLGFTDGSGSAASFHFPFGLAVDAAGNIYVADDGNQAIRKITPTGVVSTFAGGTYGFTNGTGTAATFYGPTGVAVDGSGNLFVADQGNNVVRKITPAGAVTTFATGGNGSNFYHPEGLTIDGSGNLYVTDYDNNLIRKITPNGVATTFAGKYGTNISIDGIGTAASFNQPQGVAVDAVGNLYVTDGNGLIRKITPGAVVTTFAGGGMGTATDGQGTAASFGNDNGITVDASGNIYVADRDNNMIRKITPGGLVSTVVGKGNTAGSINFPTGIVLDGTGNIYVSDEIKGNITKIAFQ